MSFQIPAPILRDLMAFRGVGFDPTARLSGDRVASEARPESSDNRSMGVLAGNPRSAEGWLLRTCSTFEDIQLETVAPQQQRVCVLSNSPTTAGRVQEDGAVRGGRQRCERTEPEQRYSHSCLRSDSSVV